ncbi:MAG: hypothetical protein OXM56_03410 [Gammaproteobacteria bacterium]|nr:hypothetical protein [Gammaproteobacteria bacterium]
MDFRTQVAEEKKRLSQQRRDAEKRIASLESELSTLAAEMKGIDGELAAIEAYESATAAPAPRSRQRRARTAEAAAPAKRTRRRRRVSRRAEIVSVIASFGAAGAGRADIIRTLDVKGDKSAEQSVSNALAALKKSGEVAHQDGKYIAAVAEEPAAAQEAAPAEAAAEPAPEPAPKGRRRRRTSRRGAIVSIIEAAGSDGIGRAGIIEQLNVKGDKSAEQSVSNALANLKKSGAVAHGDGKYTKPA